jgi:hypothetical protein
MQSGLHLRSSVFFDKNCLLHHGMKSVFMHSSSSLWYTPLYRHWGSVQAFLACRGSKGIALPFHNHSTRRGWGVSVTPRPLFTPGKDLVPIVQEVGWASGPVWTGVENLAPKGIRFPVLIDCCQSLYRLHYPVHVQPLVYICFVYYR